MTTVVAPVSHLLGARQDPRYMLTPEQARVRYRKGGKGISNAIDSLSESAGDRQAEVEAGHAECK